MGILYGIFAQIDYVVYWITSLVTQIIFDIASYPFFSQEVIEPIATRVYVVLGVLMLFRITISCIQYLVDPDKGNGKDNGTADILKRVIITVAMIALVQPVFSFMRNSQNQIATFIPKIILGINEENITETQIASIGETMSYDVWRTFVSVREGKNGSIAGSYTASSNNDGKVNGVLTTNGEIYDLESMRANISKGCGFLDFKCENRVYDYQIVLPTLVGAFMLYVLASMAFDIAIRTFKLAILEIMAPIPIASYIDPKASSQTFNTWLKTCGTVYLELFTRLIIIYFVIMFMNMILSVDSITNIYNYFSGGENGGIRAGFIIVVIVIGLLMFAKSAPKFIGDILGLKDGGDGFKDMFTRAGGLAGTGLAAIKSARSNYTTQKERLIGKGINKNNAKLKAAARAIAGATSATGRGLKMSAFDRKGFGAVKNDAFRQSIGARDSRNDRIDNLYSKEEGNKYGWLDYKHDVSRAKLGIPSAENFTKTRYDVMNSTAKLAADAKGHGVSKMNETPARYQVALNYNDSDQKAITDALGFRELSMEKVRNMYALAKNGQELDNANGTKVRLNDAQLESLGQVVQSIEKRTSYLKEAELMATGDPTGNTNVDKIRFAIKNNSSMFNDSNIINTIAEKMKKVTINGNSVPIAGADDLLKCVNELANSRHAEPKKPADYSINPNSKADYDSRHSEWVNNGGQQAWMAEISEKANILNGIKDAFEEVTSREYSNAEIAQNRAKKAQQAIKNNQDKKS